MYSDMTENAKPAVSDEEGQRADERVIACLKANHANTLALLDCLRACDVAADEAIPYREVEDALEGLPSFSLSTQSPHVLLGLLVKAGGIESVDVPEEPAQGEQDRLASTDASDDADLAELASDDASLADETADAAGAKTKATPEERPADKPIDRVLHITEAGRAALAAYDPVKRFSELLGVEPQPYLDVYVRVLDACSAEQGATRGSIEALIGQDPALFAPKRVFPSYFISKLETIGGLTWDGTWHTTDAGDRMLDALASH